MKSNNFSTESIGSPNDFQITDGDSLNNDVLTPTGTNTPEALAEPSLSEILASIKIDPTAELIPPEVAWEQIANYGDNATMGTLGNISMVYGKAKSRKSFFINMMVATLLTGSEFKGFKGCLPENKKRVLYFDTEQGTYHVQLAVSRICQQLGNPNPANLTVYALRKYKPAERVKLIEYAIENTPNVGFVVIDGIRDLVTSINDEDQATEATSNLMKWSEEQQIHIACVLHQNKNDLNARGHLGTELTNKSETVLSVAIDTADKAVSVVEADYCRNIAPELFAFEVIDNLPEIVDGYKYDKGAKKQKFDLFNLCDKQNNELLDIAFQQNSKLSYSELVSQIKIATKKLYSAKVGTVRTKDFLTYCKNNELVFQEKDRAPYTRSDPNEKLF